MIPGTISIQLFRAETSEAGFSVAAEAGPSYFRPSPLIRELGTGAGSLPAGTSEFPPDLPRAPRTFKVGLTGVHCNAPKRKRTGRSPTCQVSVCIESEVERSRTLSKGLERSWRRSGAAVEAVGTGRAVRAGCLLQKSGAGGGAGKKVW